MVPRDLGGILIFPRCNFFPVWHHMKAGLAFPPSAVREARVSSPDRGALGSLTQTPRYNIAVMFKGFQDGYLLDLP